MKKIFILALTLLMTMSLLVSCGGGGDKEEEKPAEEDQVIEFHDIQISLPKEYKYDDGSEDDMVYYTVTDDKGVVQNLVMLQYIGDGSADFSNSNFIEGYESELIDGATFYDGTGMKKVDIDDSLYAYQTSCKHDGDSGTQDVEIMGFNDSEHNLYSIIAMTSDGSSKDLMQSINDSLRYGFKVADDTEEASETEESTDSEFYFKDNVIKTKDRTIKITKWEVIQPGNNPYSSLWYQDEPVIAFWYEVTNDTDQNMPMAASWEGAVKVLQDNSDDYENKLNFAQIPDSSLTDNYLKEIKPGGTLKCATSYTLTDDTTPVTLIANNGLLGEELGRKEYDITK